jgi:ubiquinone/menaquinone biosynthesis C-methylase UbiE
MSSPAVQPNPQLFFQTVNSYQRSEAIKTAIDLELFTAIGEGNSTALEISKRCQTSERGTRILCDYLCVLGFLKKEGQQYRLTLDSATFLDKHSPAYVGDATEFLLAPVLRQAYERLTEAVRKGGSAMEEATVAPEHPVWVKFARGMAGLMQMPAQTMAKLIDPQADKPLRVLDIAAGHGLYGIALARHNPQARVVALDWPNVLQVAKENAEKFGVAGRLTTIEGNAFEVDYGTGYDLVLLTNFLHHFDPQSCETILRKVYAALTDGGRAVTLEFVPDEDRISPPEAASFSLSMLTTTPAGDAYTFSELSRMFSNTGFRHSEIYSLPPGIQQVMISQK